MSNNAFELLLKRNDRRNLTPEEFDMLKQLRGCMEESWKRKRDTLTAHYNNRFDPREGYGVVYGNSTGMLGDATEKDLTLNVFLQNRIRTKKAADLSSQDVAELLGYLKKIMHRVIDSRLNVTPEVLAKTLSKKCDITEAHSLRDVTLAKAASDFQALYENYDDTHDENYSILKRVGKLIRESSDDIKHFSDIYKMLPPGELITQWADGKFSYVQPIFKNRDDLDLYLDLLQALIREGITPFMDTKDPESFVPLIEPALTKLKERILAHEMELEKDGLERATMERARAAGAEAAAQQAQRLEEDRHRKAQESARRQADAEARAHAEFMEKPQPYAITAAAYHTLRHYAGSTAQHAKSAQIIVDMLKKTASGLDRREHALGELGHVLFSEGNLGAIASALKIGNGHTGRNVKSDLQTLRALYTSSAPVKETIDALLGDDFGILPLAALTRDAGRLSSHLDFVMKERRTLEAQQKATQAASLPLAGFSDQEIQALGDVPEVTALKKAQTTESETRKKLNEAREALAHEIRQAFQGKNVRRISSATLPAIQMQPVGVDLPGGWEALLGDEFFAALNTESAKHIDLCSQAFPYKHVTVKLNASNGVVEQKLAELRAECAQHETNLEMSAQLAKNHGFQFTTKNHQHELVHPEYDIHIPLSGSEAEQTKSLVNAQAKFEECAFIQNSVIAGLRDTGLHIDVPEKGGPITLGQNGESVTLAPRGYFSDDDFIAAQSFATRNYKAEPAAPIAPAEEEAPPSPEITPWRLKPQETPLIFDAPTLQKLATPRGSNGHSWLDIVKATAALPNGRVIIPAVIADWELRGRIPAADDKGEIHQHFEQIDPRYQKKEHPLYQIAHPLDQFLKSASRARIAPDGTFCVKEGENKNVVIVETPEDEALYARIREIQNGPEAERNRRFSAEIHKHDEGDKSITRLVEQFPLSVPMAIISDDTAYLTKDAPKTTGKGRPVAHATTGCYLDAEMRAAKGARISAIANRLKMDAADVNLKNITDMVTKFWDDIMLEQGKYAMSFAFHSAKGEPHKDARNIYEIINAGVGQAHEKPHHGPHSARIAAAKPTHQTVLAGSK